MDGSHLDKLSLAWLGSSLQGYEWLVRSQPYLTPTEAHVYLFKTRWNRPLGQLEYDTVDCRSTDSWNGSDASSCWHLDSDGGRARRILMS
jgi:hypothetical protein